MEKISIRPMVPSDRWEVAELICVSTNFWYETHGRPAIFKGGPESTVVFFDVYEALDPGCGFVAVGESSGRLAGSCFHHPRPAHISLGIMNVHPNYFGTGVARRLLDSIIALAEYEHKPLRLISSAMNLDSFSLYTRAGFVPQTAYQDMLLSVPPDGLPHRTAGDRFVRNATPADIGAMVDLEMEVAGLSREKDYRYFLNDRDGFWHASIYVDASGRVEGFLVSSGHAGCNMLGPGVMRSSDAAESLLLAEFDRHRGRTPLVLIPVQCRALVAAMYAWGAKNCETHFSQSRGPAKPLAGIVLPTFLPESG